MKAFLLATAIYIIIRSAISYINYRKLLTKYRNVLECLKKYPDDGIGWHVSMASALIECQQYKDAYTFLVDSKTKFKDHLEGDPTLSKQIDINIEFCQHPIHSSGQLKNHHTNWLQYVLIYNFGNQRANHISKNTIARVSDWVQAGKP